ncbi:MAG: aminopeptidase P family protein [Cytophagales bacterium]
MKYKDIDPKLFIKNRERFRKEIKKDSVAVFHSNDIMPTNADGTLPFKQNNDTFWMSGIDQEESILLVAPDAPYSYFKEALFIRETNEEIAIWEGHKLTKEEAKKISGIENVFWISEFDTIFKDVVTNSENIYLNTNEHLRAKVLVETRERRFIDKCQKDYPLHKYERLAPIMHKLRSVKDPIEIEIMREACSITEKAFRRILKYVKPGVNEFEVEAEIFHEFLRNGSRGPAYSSIIAGGFSSCVLHYVENDKALKDGDILLMDFGAEYANYASDMTRCIPVNGRFTERQKQIYNSVLKVMKEAKELLVPGNNWIDYHKEVGKIMEAELISLGLLDANAVKNQDPENPLYKKYFMHGTSHFIGLDVHDVGNKYHPFKEGMAFTCEPGIYLREESLGIRIENDIIVSKDGPIDLMASIPIEVEEIEDLMNEK